MIGIPAPWKSMCDGTHEPAWKVELLPPGGLPRTLPVLSVDLGVKSGGWPATTATVTWPADVIPSKMPAAYRPYGSRVKIWWRPDPREAWLLLATLWVSRVTLTRPGGQWTADCVDSSGMIDEDNIIGAGGPFGWSPAPGQTLAEACTALIRRTFPDIPVVVGPNASGPLSAPVPAEFAADERRSPWETVDALTDLAGCEAHIKPDGSFLLRTIPVLRTSPQDRVGAAINITGYELVMNSAYNTVLFSYESEDKDVEPVVGVWQDTRPDSALAVQNLGRRITWWESRKGTPTQAQADAAAAVHGRRAAGLARAVSVNIVGRPWLQPGDTVEVSFQGGPDELMQITYCEHSGQGTSRLGLRNDTYTSPLPI